MISISYFLPDVNDEIDRRQRDEDQWTQDAGHPPAYFSYLTTQGWEPEAAADWVDGCVEADRVARLGQRGAETMGITMEINYGERVPA
jgi:hypothetical protein